MHILRTSEIYNIFTAFPLNCFRFWSIMHQCSAARPPESRWMAHSYSFVRSFGFFCCFDFHTFFFGSCCWCWCWCVCMVVFVIVMQKWIPIGKLNLKWLAQSILFIAVIHCDVIATICHTRAHPTLGNPLNCLASIIIIIILYGLPPSSSIYSIFYTIAANYILIF